jgi:hypothetical protein
VTGSNIEVTEPSSKTSLIAREISGAIEQPTRHW